MRISKKHGVNPMLVVCNWCGEQNGEIALLGYIKGDREAPRQGAVNDEPCAKCREQMAQGVTLIEVTNDSTEENLERTGRWSVVDREAINKVVSPPIKDKAFITVEAYEFLGLGG